MHWLHDFRRRHILDPGETRLHKGLTQRCPLKSEVKHASIIFVELTLVRIEIGNTEIAGKSDRSV